MISLQLICGWEGAFLFSVNTRKIQHRYFVWWRRFIYQKMETNWRWSWNLFNWFADENKFHFFAELEKEAASATSCNEGCFFLRSWGVIFAEIEIYPIDFANENCFRFLLNSRKNQLCYFMWWMLFIYQKLETNSRWSWNLFNRFVDGNKLRFLFGEFEKESASNTSCDEDSLLIRTWKVIFAEVEICPIDL